MIVYAHIKTLNRYLKEFVVKCKMSQQEIHIYCWQKISISEKYNLIYKIAEISYVSCF